MPDFNPLEFGEFRGTVIKTLETIEKDVDEMGKAMRRLGDRVSSLERGNGWGGKFKTGGIGAGGAGFMLGLWKIIESML